MSDKKIKTVIVEDEEDLADTLKYKLNMYLSYVEVLGIVSNVEDAYKLIIDQKPDFIFLDIHLKDKSGFELLDLFQNPNFKTIIISADDQFGIKAVKYQIFDYLVKPIDHIELIKSVEKIKDLISINTRAFNLKGISVSTGDEIKLIQVDQIIYLEADGNYTRINLMNSQSVYASNSIKDLERKLISFPFFRTHRSYIVNIDKIESLTSKRTNSYIVLINKKIIPVSESKKKNLLKILETTVPSKG